MLNLSEMAQATVMKIVGPAVIAVTLNALLYGICLDQFIQYQICERQDSMWIKYLVLIIMLVVSSCSAIQAFGLLDVHLRHNPHSFHCVHVMVLCSR